MRCRSCGSTLRRPGDYCLVCREENADAVVVDVGEQRSTLSMFTDGELLGETTITTRSEAADPAREIQRRNYVERIADEIRRKRPEAVFADGERDLIKRLRRELCIEVYRLDGEDTVQAYRDRVDESPLTVVERATGEKLGGRHTTLIGDRRGRRVVQLIAEHPHVKKIVPGPIDGSGSGSRSGFHAKVTRPDTGGNLRALLHDGSTVQEVRLVTTASDFADGERIATQLNEAFRDADLSA